jgi:hypothetical protein
MCMKTILAALLAVALTAPAMAENLDVSVITVKKFTVNDHGGIVMPAGADSYYDFLEVTNKEDLPVTISKVEAYLGIQKNCVIIGNTLFPLSLPSKSTLEFTLGCGVSSLSIGVGNRVQEYDLVGPMLRIATPVFQVHYNRSN